VPHHSTEVTSDDKPWSDNVAFSSFSCLYFSFRLYNEQLNFI